MTPKEKAKELVKNMFQPPIDSLESQQGQKYFFNQFSAAKPCALIAVDEILKVSISYAGKDYDYWQEVKQEIEKL